MTLRSLWQGWLNFWFQPASPLPVAVYRIVYGLIVLWFCFLLAPDLLFWFGPDSAVSNPVSREWPTEILLDPLNLFPHTETAVKIAFGTLVTAAFCLTIGLFTRLSALIVFLLLVSFHHQNWLILNSGDTIMRISAGYLAVSNCGDALSVDRLISAFISGAKVPRAPTPKAPWAQRLMQIQLTLLYGQAFFSKLAGEMWVNGTALYYTTRLEDFRRFYCAPVVENLELLKILTWGTLAIEFSLFTLIWLKDLRYYIIAAGVALHLAIDLTMNLPIFQWLMMAAFIPFIYPEDLQLCASKMRSFADRVFGPPKLILYNGAVKAEAARAEVIARLDVLHRRIFVDASLAQTQPLWQDLLSNSDGAIKTYGSSLFPPGAGGGGGGGLT